MTTRRHGSADGMPSLGERSNRLLLALLTGSAFVPAVTMAQVAPAPAAVQATPDAPEDTSANDIVVTAQKREQRVQDVPLAIQVLTASSLQAQGVREFTDLTKAVPSLVVRAAEKPTNASVSIRGIGTFAFAAGVEPSVAVQVDDVPVALLARAFSDLSDIERLEVLRGPQSTLYGRSASAGLINIITQSPTATLTGRVAALATSDEEYGWNMSAAGPLTSTLGFRVSGQYNYYRGNIYNTFRREHVNGRKNVTLKGKLVWEPTSAISVTGQLNYLDGTSTTGRPFAIAAPTSRLRGDAAVTPAVFAAGVTIGPDNDQISTDRRSGFDYRDFSQSLRVSVDLGGPTFMSISAHDRYRGSEFLDQDETAVPQWANFQFSDLITTQWSQEFRLISPGKDRFRYTLGLFYTGLDIALPVVSRGPAFSLAGWAATNNINQYAGFGQLEFDILPTTTLIGGIRYGRNDIDVTFTDRLAGTNYAGKTSDDYTTYKAAVQQRLSDDVMLFASYATGYKGEAYDIGTGFNQSRIDSPVRPETSKDWQAGIKSQFFDRRVTLNATVFDTRFTGFQAQGIETMANGQVNFRLSNVGRLRTRGVEIEGSVRAADTLDFSGGVTYNDAKIQEFPFAQCYSLQTVAQGCNPAVPASGTTPARPASQNLADFRPAQAPEWKLSTQIDFTPRLTDDLNLLLQAAFSYQSKFNFLLSNDPFGVQKEFGILNLTAGIRPAGKNWELAAFVNNVTNKQYYANVLNNTGNFGGQLLVQSYLPRDFKRYVGVRASHNF